MSQSKSLLKLNGTKAKDVREAHVIKTFTPDAQGNTLEWVVRSFELSPNDVLFDIDETSETRYDNLNAYIPDFETKELTASVFSSGNDQLNSHVENWRQWDERVYGWANLTAYSVFPESETEKGMGTRFDTTAGVNTHYLVGVLLASKAEKLRIPVHTNLPKGGDGRVLLNNDCTRVATRYLRYYSWLGVDTEAIIRKVVDQTLDLFVLNQIEKITIEPNGVGADFVFHLKGGGQRLVELKTFHYQTEEKAKRTLQQCVDIFSVVFVALRHNGGNERAATIGSWTTLGQQSDLKEVIKPTELALKPLPMFTVFDQVRHTYRDGNLLSTLCGRVVHALFAWLIMTPNELNDCGIPAVSKSGEDTDDATFKADRNKLFGPLLSVLVYPGFNSNLLTRLASRLKQFFRGVYDKLHIPFVVELKTRWTDDSTSSTTKIRQERADFIVCNCENIQVTLQIQILTHTFAAITRGEDDRQLFNLRMEFNTPINRPRIQPEFSLQAEQTPRYDGTETKKGRVKLPEGKAFSFKDTRTAVTAIQRFILINTTITEGSELKYISPSRTSPAARLVDARNREQLKGRYAREQGRTTDVSGSDTYSSGGGGVAEDDVSEPDTNSSGSSDVVADVDDSRPPKRGRNSTDTDTSPSKRVTGEKRENVFVRVVNSLRNFFRKGP